MAAAGWLRMKRAFVMLILLSLCAPALARGQGGNPEGAYFSLFGSQRGRLLVARPGMPDYRFRQSVILLVKHGEKGALGLILNHVARRMPLSALYRRFHLEAPRDAGAVDIHYGGPVAPHSGFVIHTTEHKLDTVYEMEEGVAISPVDVVLEAIARGRRPRKSVFVVGYSGWGAGQLEREMRRGDWYAAPADPDILFDDGHDSKWSRAMERRFRMM